MAFSEGRRMLEGDRAFSHQSTSNWQFNLIPRFHLPHFTSNGIDNNPRYPDHFTVCLWMFMGRCVSMCAHVFVHPYRPFPGLLLFKGEPSLLSLSCRPCFRLCSPEKAKGIGFLFSFYLTLKHSWACEAVVGEMAGKRRRHTAVHTSTNIMIAFVSFRVSKSRVSFWKCIHSLRRRFSADK